MEGRVRFKEDVALEEHAVKCTINDKSSGHVDVGLLQVLHTYIVAFDMNHNLGDTLDIPPLQTPAITVISLRKLENGCGHHVILEVKCHEDEYLKEKIRFENFANETFILNIHAKLMPIHLGTPSLKSGVKVLHRADDSNSDAGSDWQGFK